jgi:hypothetical protein
MLYKSIKKIHNTNVFAFIGVLHQQTYQCLGFYLQYKANIPRCREFATETIKLKVHCLSWCSTALAGPFQQQVISACVFYYTMVKKKTKNRIKQYL